MVPKQLLPESFQNIGNGIKKLYFIKDLSKINYHSEQNKNNIQLNDQSNESSKSFEYLFVCNTSAYRGW